MRDYKMQIKEIQHSLYNRYIVILCCNSYLLLKITFILMICLKFFNLMYSDRFRDVVNIFRSKKYLKCSRIIVQN